MPSTQNMERSGQPIRHPQECGEKDLGEYDEVREIGTGRGRRWIKLCKGNMELNFDKRYVEPILKGEKKTTIRKGVKLNFLHKGMETGNVAHLVVEGEVFAQAKITRVIVKRADELTEDDAVLDGFRNLKELTSALHRIYGGLNHSDLITIIHFEIME